MHPLTYNTTRQIVTTTRGQVLAIKEHRGWQYVNYQGRKVGLSTLPTANDTPKPYDIFINYVASGLYITHPCKAVEYWLYRYRLHKKITPTQYQQKFLITNKNKTT